MKKFGVIILLFICFFLCGFSQKKKPLILFSKSPISKETTDQITKYLSVNERIYYIVIVPKGMKKGTYRAQIVKKDEKSEFWGYKYCRHYDYRITENDTKSLTDYFVLLEPGFYFMQFFNMENINKPIVMGEFWVR